MPCNVPSIRPPSLGHPSQESLAPGRSRYLAWLSCALFALAVSSARADGEGLDLTELNAHVGARAATTADGDRKVNKAYLKLEKALAKRGLKGLAGDYAILKKVASAQAKQLTADKELERLLDAALDDGQAQLAGEEGEVRLRLGLFDPGKTADKLAGKLEKASATARDSILLRFQGEEDPKAISKAIAKAGKAAKAYAKVLKAVDKARAKELKKPSGPPHWGLPLQGLGGALLSVWGEPGPAPALYAVGASDGEEPTFLVLPRRADAWIRVPTGLEGDLWWVNVVPSAGVWACGTGGIAMSYDPATGHVTDRSTGVNATLYGIWGTGPNNIWAVGGNPIDADPRPAIVHWNGAAWQQVTAPAEVAGKLLYKVFATGPDDVWACGQGGALIHFDGGSWSAVDAGTPSTLFSIHGASPTIAVGGAGVAAVMVSRGAAGAFSPVTLAGGLPGLNGVFVPPNGDALAVGFARTVLSRQSGIWTSLPDVPEAALDFHAAWMDDDGNAVLVGGDLFSLTGGVLASRGHRALPSEVIPQAKLRPDVATIVYDTCALSGCHLAPFANEGLDTTTADAFFASVSGVPSTESPLLRVNPGWPEQSYLWHKLQGTQLSVGGDGDPMPQEGEPLEAAKLNAIRAWILEGALDN